MDVGSFVTTRPGVSRIFNAYKPQPSDAANAYPLRDARFFR